MSAALTVRIDEATIARLDALASERRMTREEIVQVAVEEHVAAADAEPLALEDWQIADIEEGLAQAERGEFASDEEVKAIFDRYRS